MTAPTAIERLQARIDRLPAGWLIIAAGFAGQFLLALVLLGVAYSGGEWGAVAGAAFLTMFVVVAGLAALPAAVLFHLGRYQRGAAALAAVVGVVMLVVNEGHLTVWLFPLALFVAAVRGWVRATLDTADLLRVDPGRFERVDPPADESDG